MQETFPTEIAKIYDRVMSYFDYAKSADLLDQLIKSDAFQLSGTPTLLEVGIGTGSLALELIKKGYHIEGLDHSKSMIEIAVSKGIPSSWIHYADVVNFDIGRKFDIIISHAGPIRFDYTHRRGYFIDTYLSRREKVERAMNNIAYHLSNSGVFIMSVQNFPGRDPSLQNTAQYQSLGDGYIATKEIIEEGDIRIKKRIFKKDDREIASIEHRCLMLDLSFFNALAARYGLEDCGFDLNNIFKVYKRSS